MNSPVVVARDLTVRFGDFTAVDGISFSVDRGEVFGFLGANGAGKTTTIRVLCGLLVPTAGETQVAGLTFDHGAQAIKRKVGYMSQRFTLYNDLTVQENLAFTASLRKLAPDYLARRARDLLEFVRFDHPLDTRVADLPGGIKQELALVAALLHDPEIIFLDEPTAGVAPAARARFWSLIRRLSAEGKTIFVTTHYMDEAEQCGRIALMRAGQIIALDSPEGLKSAAFPEPLVEIEAEPGLEKGWAEQLRRRGAVTDLQPYGLRFRAAVGNADALRETARSWGEKIRLRPIRPSLEDVFIRLVEGTNR